MKASKNIVFITALIAGLILMFSPASFTALIVLIIGGAVILSGAWAIIANLRDHDESRGTLISGIVRALIGIYMITHKATVLSIIPVGIGILLLAEGITGLKVSYGNAKYMNIAMIVLGIILLFNPIGSLHSAVFWCGVLLCGYGILGLVRVNYWKYY